MQTDPPVIVQQIADNPPPKSGFLTSQFWLIVIALAALGVMVFDDKLNATVFAFVAGIVATIYNNVRTKLHAAHLERPTDPYLSALDSILSQVPDLTAADVAQIVTSIRSLSTPLYTYTLEAPKAGESGGASNANTSVSAAAPSGVPGGALALVIGMTIIGCLFGTTGCAGTGRAGTQYVQSVEASASAERDAQTGNTRGTVGIKVDFRDGRDSKTIKPLSLRDSALDERMPLGVQLLQPFKLDIDAMQETEALKVNGELWTWDARHERIVNPPDAPFPLIVSNTPEGSR